MAEIVQAAPVEAQGPGKGVAARMIGVITSPGEAMKEIVAKPNTEVARILVLPDVKEKLSSQGTEPLPNSPQEMGKWLAAEKERWARLVKETGFKLE